MVLSVCLSVCLRDLTDLTGLTGLKLWPFDFRHTCTDGLKWSDPLISLIHLNCLISDHPDAVSGLRQIDTLLMLSFVCLVLHSLMLAWRAFMDEARTTLMSQLTVMQSSSGHH